MTNCEMTLTSCTSICGVFEPKPDRTCPADTREAYYTCMCTRTLDRCHTFQLFSSCDRFRLQGADDLG